AALLAHICCAAYRHLYPRGRACRADLHRRHFPGIQYVCTRRRRRRWSSVRVGHYLGGGCASGTWYRSAEGLVGSWIALAMYALSAAMMKTGALAGFNDWMKSWDTGLTTLPEAFGISAWWFAI